MDSTYGGCNDLGNNGGNDSLVGIIVDIISIPGYGHSLSVSHIMIPHLVLSNTSTLASTLYFDVLVELAKVIMFRKQNRVRREI